MDLKQLRIVRALAEEKHFGRTATRLGVSPATVSQSLSRLEAELGHKLVERDSRNVELTGQGRFFLTEVNGALQRLDAAVEILRMQKRDVGAHLRIGTSFPGSKLVLPPVLDYLRDAHPELVVTVRNLGSALQEDALLNDEIDIGFLAGPALRDGVESRVALTTEVVCLTRPAHPLVRDGMLDLRHAGQYPHIGAVPGARTEVYARVQAAASSVGALLGPTVPAPADLYLEVASSDLLAFCTRPRAEQGVASGLQLAEIYPRPELLPLHVTWRRSDSNRYVTSIRSLVEDGLIGGGIVAGRGDRSP